MVCSLLGSSVHGISQARILRRLPFLSPGDLPDPGINPCLLQTHGGCFTTEPPGNYSRLNWKEGRRTYKGISLHDTDSQHYGPDSWPQVHTGKHSSQAWESPGTSNPCRERWNFPSPGQLGFGTFTWRVLVAAGGGLETAAPAEWTGSPGDFHVAPTALLPAAPHAGSVSTQLDCASSSSVTSRFQVGKGRCKRRKVS